MVNVMADKKIKKEKTDEEELNPQFIEKMAERQKESTVKVKDYKERYNIK